MKTPSDPVVDRERFLALYASYVRLYERFLENGFKISTLLLVLMGWLLGSAEIRNFIRESPAIRWSAIVVVAFGAVSIYLSFKRIALLSVKLRRRLDELNYVEPEVYEQHEIPRVIYRTVIGQNIFACALVIGILLSLPWK